MVGKIEETSSMLQELERNLNLQLEENRILKDELLKEKTKFNNEKERLMKNAYEEANKIIEKARFDSKQLIDEIEAMEGSASPLKPNEKVFERSSKFVILFVA